MYAQGSGANCELGQSGVNEPAKVGLSRCNSQWQGWVGFIVEYFSFSFDYGL